MHKGSCSLVGQGVLGWVYSEGDPLWVELVCDGVSLAIARADETEPNGCGFFLPVPAPLFDEGATITVRIANTDETVGQAITIPAPEADGTKNDCFVLGEALVDRGLTIRGWALDTRRPDKFLTVMAMENGVRLGQALANKASHTEHGEAHGFTLSLPLQLADGEKHSICLETAEGQALPGSPVTVLARPESLDVWFTNKKSLTPSERDFLAHILKRLECYNPGALLSYEEWKKAFPAQQAGGKRPQEKKGAKIRLSVVMGSSGPTENASSAGKTRASIKRQQGVTFEIVDRDADCTLLVGEGDILAPHALATLLSVLRREKEPAILYADGETLEYGKDGREAPKTVPLCKPAWNRAFFLEHDYLGPLLLPKAVAQNISLPGENAGFSLLSPDEYFSLRVRAVRYADENARILHLPEILAQEGEMADRAGPAARREAVDAWLGSLAGNAHVEPDTHGLRVRITMDSPPKVSIIIPTRDHADLLRRCLDSLEKTQYQAFETLVVDNDSREPSACEYLASIEKRPSVRLLSWPGLFNYSLINNFAAREATGDILCFLNNDTEILHPEWLTEMVSLLMANDTVGCVGAKLLWPNLLVQHGGVIVGIHNLAGHVGNTWFDDEPGYMWRNRHLQEYSAVTAACMVTPKKLFLDLSGFDGVRFPVAFNDVDYCLRLRDMGKKVLWTPYARLMHHESASRGKDTLPQTKARSLREMSYFRTMWGMREDPFYNPNLPLSTVTEPFCGLALPPRPRTPR